MNNKNFNFCPNCGKPIGLWQVAKPSIYPNRFTCKSCGIRFKHNYSWLMIIIFSTFGFFVGVAGTLLTAMLAFIITGDILLNSFFPVFIGLLIPTTWFLMVFAGYCEALYSKKRYEFISIK